LTHSDHIIYELKRPFTIKELLQLQGFPKNFKVVVSKTQIAKQIGNSMSVCVLKKIIKEALLCI
jgi:DNA (cytosine-5)-methyltransferase 1